MNTDQIVRDHLLALLHGGSAYMTFDQAIINFPMDRINERPPNVPYTLYHVLEHMRITQWDILDYIRNPNYKEMEWPKDYWPAQDVTADQTAWEETIRQFKADKDEIESIVKAPKTDLYAPIPHGYGGHTLLREVLVVADHNAYHTGEFGILRQVMNAW